ncbi:hypothetical protein BHE74_00045242 [Ensete ventricosum]|nr:hypothetical protein BHE74_00045242 [Ensete ventricosum]
MSMHRARVQTIQLGTHQECVRNSPRVSGVYQDGVREFTERRPRLAERLSGVAERLAGSWEGPSRNSKCGGNHFSKDSNRGLDGSRPRHGWSGSDPCPLYLMVQLFFLDTREGNRRHKSVRMPRLYFSSDLQL